MRHPCPRPPLARAMALVVSAPGPRAPSIYFGVHILMALDSHIAARYEAAKAFDLEDDLEYCPVLTIDEVCRRNPPHGPC
jgi:hypothetical protein